MTPVSLSELSGDQSLTARERTADVFCYPRVRHFLTLVNARLILTHLRNGDPRVLADLAREAEDHGWDGFFIWDHIIAPGALPVADATVALASIAVATHRIQFGPMVVALPRRSPWKVAREAVTLDRLSNGRLILGIGAGGDWFAELTTFGLPLNDAVRAEQLD